MEMAKTMKTVTLEIASAHAVTRRALDAFKGKKQRARISFATPELLWRVLTAKRWELLKAMAAQGPMTIRRAPDLLGVAHVRATNPAEKSAPFIQNMCYTYIMNLVYFTDLTRAAPLPDA